MENPDLNKIFYGTDASDIIKKFNEGLLLIEEENVDYFDNIVSDSGYKDRLHNHYIITTNSFGMTFNFLEDSNLDSSIKLKCSKLFVEIFTPQNLN